MTRSAIVEPGDYVAVNLARPGGGVITGIVEYVDDLGVTIKGAGQEDPAGLPPVRPIGRCLIPWTSISVLSLEDRKGEA